MPDEPEQESRRTVGSTLGTWARRVGDLVAEFSSGPSIPEPLRASVQEAVQARRHGDLNRARSSLRELVHQHGDVLPIVLELAMVAVHDALLGDPAEDTLQACADKLADSPYGPGFVHLLSGVRALVRGDTDLALDELRRALRDDLTVSHDLRAEAGFLLHVALGVAHARRGSDERALRELQKSLAIVPVGLRSGLRTFALRRTVELLLDEERASEAEALVLRARRHPDEWGERDPIELHAAACAVRGDAVGAHALILEADARETPDVHAILVGLRVGLPVEVATTLSQLAWRYLQADADDPARRRIWALVEAQRTDSTTPIVEEILRTLLAAAKAAPSGRKARHFHELAYFALAFDRLPAEVATALAEQLDRDPAGSAEELRLLQTRQRIAANDVRMHDEFTQDHMPSFRPSMELVGPWGPDAFSPLRHEDRRNSLLRSQRALVSAEYCMACQHSEAAQEHLVAALLENPELGAAKRLLTIVADQPTGTRLEDHLTAATRLLGSLPRRVLGIPLTGIEESLAMVVAARERIARPLTIALMGEFSSGKSTVLNALMGAAIAPMGVLPTTSTINVFRRGASGGARVHYRDGKVGIIEADDVAAFLHRIDDAEAASIRHVEIERTSGSMGDARIVDTPGLNALDAFHEQVARGFLDESDAIVWVFSATRGGAASEAGLLSMLRASGRSVLGLLNKADTLDEAEKSELAAYLSAQLGDVLVEVVSVAARDALLARTSGERNASADAFTPVEQALERHFLQHARQLKWKLALRGLRDALRDAKASISNAIALLEERARTTAHLDDDVDRDGLILRFAEALADRIRDLDDTVTREALSLGVFRTGKSRPRPVDEQDAAYLSGLVADAAIGAIAHALADLTPSRAVSQLGDVVHGSLIPWARGYVDAQAMDGFMLRMLQAVGSTSNKSEAEFRVEVRSALEAMAQAWRKEALRLTIEVKRASDLKLARSSHAPRAEALRLRLAVVGPIEVLERALEGLPADPAT